MNSKINSYSKSLNENIFNLEKKNKRTLLEELLIFFNILKKSNEFEKINKNICSYTPTWDYTFKANTIKKNIINLKNNENNYQKCSTNIKKNKSNCAFDNINITYSYNSNSNILDSLHYECPKVSDSKNENNVNYCRQLTENLFTTWQLYNREDWPKTPSKELSSFYNLLLMNKNLNLRLIIKWASEVKDDLDREYRYRKKGLKYYSKYNPFELDYMFKVLQQYTARTTWPEGKGISYNGNNEKVMTKENVNEEFIYNELSMNYQITDLEEEFDLYKKNINLNVNNFTNKDENIVEENNIINLYDILKINDASKIENAFEELIKYFKTDNKMLCLIGTGETLLTDEKFSKSLSTISDKNGEVKHYSKQYTINNHYDELDDDNLKNYINIINDLKIIFKVGNTFMNHVIGSLTELDKKYLESLGYGIELNVGFSKKNIVIAFGNTIQDLNEIQIQTLDPNETNTQILDSDETDKQNLESDEMQDTYEIETKNINEVMNDEKIIVLPYCEANEWTYYPYPKNSAKICFPSCDDGYLELYIITPSTENNNNKIYGGGFYYKARDREEILYVVHDETGDDDKSNNDLIDTLLGLKKMGTINNNSDEMDSFSQNVIVMKGEENMFENFNNYISYQISSWESPILNNININNGCIYYKYRQIV